MNIIQLLSKHRFADDCLRMKALLPNLMLTIYFMRAPEKFKLLEQPKFIFLPSH